MAVGPAERHRWRDGTALVSSRRSGRIYAALRAMIQRTNQPWRPERSNVELTSGVAVCRLELPRVIGGLLARSG